MDETLDLDYSCSSDEIITKSPKHDSSHTKVNKEIFKAQQMLDSLKLNYLKTNQKYKLYLLHSMHKSNSHIIKENHNLKKRIEELEKKLRGNQNFSIPKTLERDKAKQVDQSLSLSMILNSNSLVETAASQRCCCSHGGSVSPGKGLCSFYQIRSKLGIKRSRPSSWYVEKPKKKLFTDIVLSQLPLFRF